jgi:hypothetical protein
MAAGVTDDATRIRVGYLMRSDARRLGLPLILAGAGAFPMPPLTGKTGARPRRGT